MNKKMWGFVVGALFLVGCVSSSTPPDHGTLVDRYWSQDNYNGDQYRFIIETDGEHYSHLVGPYAYFTCKIGDSWPDCAYDRGGK
jgi:hypothetical protein